MTVGKKSFTVCVDLRLYYVNIHVPAHVHFTLVLAVTGEWTTPPTSGTAPTPRQGHIIAVIGNRMFVHGGMSGQKIFNDLYTLNLGEFYSFL